MNRRSNTSL